MSLIISAGQYAETKHAGQKRKYNGKPYICHPIRVAGRVATHEKATEIMVAAAYLHDVVEDCGVDLSEIYSRFGEDVAHIVGELTTDDHIDGNRAERKKIAREKIKTISWEAKLIKLIDRIDNLNELDWTDGFSNIYAKESLLLLNEALIGTDPQLEEELKNIILGILQIHERV